MIGLALALMAAETPPDPEWNCDEPKYQQEMNWCAGQDFLKADAALNVQWKLTAAAMKQWDDELDRTYDKAPGYFETLLEGQRAWLKYRDAQCTSEGFAFRGGSMEPLVVATCKTRLTEARTSELKDLIEGEG